MARLVYVQTVMLACLCGRRGVDDIANGWVDAQSLREGGAGEQRPAEQRYDYQDSIESHCSETPLMIAPA